MSTMAQLVRSICSNQATALTKTGALYFISVKTEQQRVGEYLNLNFAGYLNFKRDEPELELHIQKSKTLKGKIAKTTGLPSATPLVGLVTEQKNGKPCRISTVNESLVRKRHGAKN